MAPEYRFSSLLLAWEASSINWYREMGTQWQFLQLRALTQGALEGKGLPHFHCCLMLALGTADLSLGVPFRLRTCKRSCSMRRLTVSSFELTCCGNVRPVSI